MFVIQFYLLFFYRQRFVNFINGFPVSTETRRCFVLFIFHSFSFQDSTDALQCVSIMRANIYHLPHLYRRMAIRLYHARKYLSFTPICTDALQRVSIMRNIYHYPLFVQTHCNASLSYAHQCNASILLNFPYPQFLQIFIRTIIIFCLAGMIFGIAL